MEASAWTYLRQVVECGGKRVCERHAALAEREHCSVGIVWARNKLYMLSAAAMELNVLNGKVDAQQPNLYKSSRRALVQESPFVQ